jgi:hypothetical protein
MNRLFLTFLLALCTIISASANPTPTEEVATLISDKPAAASKIQHFLDAIYKSGNTQLVDNSLFSTYSSGDHRYLIAKAYITFYNENVRQQARIRVSTFSKALRRSSSSWLSGFKETKCFFGGE